MNKHLTGAMWLILQSVVLNVLSVPATAIIIRNVGPEGFGQWVVTTSIVGITSFITGIGLREVFIQNVIHEPERAATLISHQMGLRFLLSLLAAAFSVAFCLLFRYGWPMLVLTTINAGSMVISTSAAVLSDYLQGHNRLRTMAAIQMVAGFVLTILSVVFTTIRPSIVMLGLAYAAGPSVSLFLLVMIMRRDGVPCRLKFSFSEFGALIRKSRVLILPQFLNNMRDRLEPLLIPKVIGMDAFGYYSAGTMPASRMNIIADGIVTSYYSALAKQSTKSADSSADMAVQLIKIVLLVCLPIACYLYALAGPVSYILFPQRPQVCMMVMQLTCWAIPIAAVGQACACVLQSTGRLTEAARSVSLGTLIGAAMTLVCIYLWGIAGASIALVARSCVAALLTYSEVRSIYRSAIKHLPVVEIVISSMAILLIFFTSNIDKTLVSSNVVVFVALSATAYVASLLILRVVSVSQLRSLLVGLVKAKAV